MQFPKAEVAETYAALRGTEAGRTVDQFASLAQADQYRRLYSIASKYVPKGARALDWGSGNGHFSFFLARQGAFVTSFSFDGEPQVFSLLTPAERSRVTFVRGSADDPQALPFDASSFDAVFSVGVLEHVRETGGTEIASMREIRRVLAPGGLFICYHLPNRYSYIEAMQRFRHRKSRNASVEGDYGLPWLYHAYRYTKADIRALCDETGFSLVEMDRYGALPRNTLARLPSRMRDSRGVAAAVNGIDGLLERVIAPVSQNFAFVARRPDWPGTESRRQQDIR